MRVLLVCLSLMQAILEVLRGKLCLAIHNREVNRMYGHLRLYSEEETETESEKCA
jgi:hypothetical protein